MAEQVVTRPTRPGDIRRQTVHVERLASGGFAHQILLHHLVIQGHPPPGTDLDAMNYFFLSHAPLMVSKCILLQLSDHIMRIFSIFLKKTGQRDGCVPRTYDGLEMNENKANLIPISIVSRNIDRFPV